MNTRCKRCKKDVGHPFVRRADGALWCLPCYARKFGRPMLPEGIRLGHTYQKAG